MNFSSLHLDIIDYSEIIPECFYFKFKGKFTEDASIAGGKAWDLAFETTPNIECHLIWDGSEMSGFEIGAREEWYRAINRNRKKIGEITVISNSVFVRGTARVMLEYFNIDHKMLKSFSELPTPVISALEHQSE